jgi:hypothetical protein
MWASAQVLNRSAEAHVLKIKARRNPKHSAAESEAQRGNLNFETWQ